MHAWFDRQFLFVTGKGGVGRTTASAAMALRAAASGRRVLVAMCNAKDRLSYLLEVDPIGPHNQPIGPRLDAVNMVPEIAVREYADMVLRVRALTRAIFESRFVAAFLRGTPGLAAWSMLGKTYFHANETDETGARRYDLVIVDAPATGHALDMLRVPKVLVEIAPPGLLRREAEAAWTMFHDPTRSGVVLFTLPEEMPTNETLELHAAVEGELRLPIAAVVANGVLTPIFEPAERGLVRSLADALPEASPLEPLARAGRTRSLREALQARALQRLEAALPYPQIRLPYLFMREFRRVAVERLSEALDVTPVSSDASTGPRPS